VPRSGTTWVARIIAASLGGDVVDEPDNHFVAPYAFKVKRELQQGNYPSLSVGATAPGYESLWLRASGLEPRPRDRVSRARRTLSRRLLARQRPEHVTRTLAGLDEPHAGLRLAGILAVPEQPAPNTPALVVKSVHAPLCADWVASLCSLSVVVVIRHPLNVLSSWLELGWLGEDVLETLAPPLRAELAARYGVPLPSQDWTEIEKGAWVCAALTCAAADIGLGNQAHVLVTHEDLYRNPRGGFRLLADRLGLAWNAEGDRLLEELNRPGRGYETARVAEDLEGVWRKRLSPRQASEATDVLRHFPLERWSSLVSTTSDG
jgi:hypothetical protein